MFQGPDGALAVWERSGLAAEDLCAANMFESFVKREVSYLKFIVLFLTKRMKNLQITGKIVTVLSKLNRTEVNLAQIFTLF